MDINEKTEKQISITTTNKKANQIDVGDIVVTVEYAKTDKKLSECMLNILKQKSKEV